MKIMKERRDYIKNSIESADNKLKEAEKARDEYLEDLKHVEDYKKGKIEEINKELISYKDEELSKIKQDLETKKTNFNSQLEFEKEEILNNLIRKFCFGLDDFLKDIFTSLTNNSLNAVIFDKFLNEILNLSDENIDKIKKSSTTTINFYSSYELNQEEKDRAKSVFEKTGVVNKQIDFVVDENMIFGNRITVNGFVMNLNIQDIIDRFVLNIKNNV